MKGNGNLLNVEPTGVSNQNLSDIEELKSKEKHRSNLYPWENQRCMCLCACVC